MKIILAKLKTPVTVSVTLHNTNFNDNWLEASNVIECSKRKLMQELKESMHNKIAELSIDDIDFTIEDFVYRIKALD